MLTEYSGNGEAYSGNGCQRNFGKCSTPTTTTTTSEELFTPLPTFGPNSVANGGFEDNTAWISDTQPTGFIPQRAGKVGHWGSSYALAILTQSTSYNFSIWQNVPTIQLNSTIDIAVFLSVFEKSGFTRVRYLLGTKVVYDTFLNPGGSWAWLSTTNLNPNGISIQKLAAGMVAPRADAFQKFTIEISSKNSIPIQNNNYLDFGWLLDDVSISERTIDPEPTTTPTRPTPPPQTTSSRSPTISSASVATSSSVSTTKTK